MFDKRSKRILMIFGVTVLLILITEVTRPTPINWSASYASFDKIPFGTFVLFEELDDLFESAEIEMVNEDPYVFLNKKAAETNSAYVFINDNLQTDKRQVSRIKEYVAAGNTVFMSARYFGTVLEDSLGFSTTPYFSNDLKQPALEPAFFNDKSEKDSLYAYDKGVEKTVFVKVDTLATTALGYVKDAADPMERLNFIRVEHGEGAFYLHALPEAFSNYYMLNGREDYTAHVMSYVDTRKLYWDEYLKSGRKVVTSPMRFVLNQKALTWSYYLLVFSLILFVIFRAKREQRVIEVVEPLANTSVEFSRTIGQMYFQHKDYSNIIAKKINYFLEVVRTRYFLDTMELDKDFTEKLALKSANNIDKTKKLIKLVRHLRSKALHTEADLVELNKQIEAFNL